MNDDLKRTVHFDSANGLDALLPSRRMADLRDEAPADTDHDGDPEGGAIEIRPADSDGCRSAAHLLVSRMYAWRGYATASAPEGARADRVTLLACDGDATVGTLTVAFDGADGLLSEEAFGEDIGRLREQGLVLCEFVKLAVGNVVRSKKILASLMQAALLCAREAGGCGTALIEVNPRHVRFYRQILGFKVLSAARRNARVDAPAVLMGLDLDDADLRVDQARRAPSSIGRLQRSLYQHAFSRDEVAGMSRRLQHAARC